MLYMGQVPSVFWAIYCNVEVLNLPGGKYTSMISSANHEMNTKKVKIEKTPPIAVLKEPA